MAFWQWTLIDLAILTSGAIWHGVLVRELGKSAKRMANENEKLIEKLSLLSLATESTSTYQRPVNNLNDSALEKTTILLKRMRTQDQKREAKKRRLIARFSTRK